MRSSISPGSFESIVAVGLMLFGDERRILGTCTKGSEMIWRRRGRKGEQGVEDFSYERVWRSESGTSVVYSNLDNHEHTVHGDLSP